MKQKPLHDDGAEKSPKGQCPLCYFNNSYSVSHCVECNYPLPWVNVPIYEREPHGSCPKCHAENSYSMMNCRACDAFLPWAFAISSLMGAPIIEKQSVELPAVPPLPVSSVGYSGKNTLAALDGRNQFVDAISFLCPALGFVAYISLLGRLPQQALSAAKFALYGLCVWLPALLILLVRSQ